MTFKYTNILGIKTELLKMLCMAWLMSTSLVRDSSTLFHVHHTPDLRPSFCFFDQVILTPRSAPLHVPCLLSDGLPQKKSQSHFIIPISSKTFPLQRNSSQPLFLKSKCLYLELPILNLFSHCILPTTPMTTLNYFIYWVICYYLFLFPHRNMC